MRSAHGPLTRLVFDSTMIRSGKQGTDERGDRDLLVGGVGVGRQRPGAASRHTSVAVRQGRSTDRAVTELYSLHYRAPVRLAVMLVRDVPTGADATPRALSPYRVEAFQAYLHPPVPVFSAVKTLRSRFPELFIEDSFVARRCRCLLSMHHRMSGTACARPVTGLVPAGLAGV